MPNLTDLKNNAAKATEKKEPYIPHILPTDEKNIVYTQKPRPKRPMGILPSPYHNEADTDSEQHVADLSALPTGKKPGEGSVTIKESIQKEVFDGGMFDEFLERKEKEFDDFNRQIENEAEAEGLTPISIEEFNKIKDGELTMDEVKERREEEKTDVSNLNTNEIDIFADEEKPEKVDEEPTVDDIKEDEFRDVTEDDDIPFELDDNTSMANEEIKNEVENSDEAEGEVKVDLKGNVSKPEETKVEKKDTTPIVDISTSSIKKDINIIDDINTDDDEANPEEIDIENDKELLSLRDQITEKIKPVAKKLNISGFRITDKPAANNAIAYTQDVSVAKWPLMITDCVVMFRQLLGVDLETLRMAVQSNDVRAMLQCIYDNIVSAKPKFDVWLKSVAFADYDHLFMGLFIASFNGANYMPVDCRNDKCTERSYITDNIPFTELVDYKDDKAKKEFQALYKSEKVDYIGLKVYDVVPISENYAIAFKIPSLYDRFIEPAYFDDEFTQKHASAISINPYIHKIYKINWADQSLSPIEYKVYDNNDAKTAKGKIGIYSKIFATLSTDELSAIRATTDAIDKSESKISYKMPETTCPHCGHVNPENKEMTASQMLFLRQQLSLLQNTYKN